MANKDIKLDEYGDLDIDAELEKLNDLNFGETEKPKSGREATFKVLRDASHGAASSFKFNAENVDKLVNAAMPSSLRGEYYDTYNAVFGKGGIKEALDNGLKDVKRSARGVTSTLQNMVSKDGRLYKVLDKLNKKLGDDSSFEDKLAANNGMLLDQFRSELDNIFNKESSLSLLQSSIQQKQFNSTIEVQNSMNKHLSVIRNFHLEITNNYYKKSLEIQYRSLLASEGQFKALTEGFNLIKQQNEAIIKNTALPEFVKIKTSEQFKQVMLSNTATNLQNFMFKEISAIDKIKKSLSNRIKYNIENFTEGLGMIEGTAEMAQTMKELESMGGPSKSFMLGNSIGNFTRDFLGKHVVDKLSNTKRGKLGIFGLKNMMADPSGWADDKLKNLRKNKNSNAGFLGKSKDWLLESFYTNVRDMASIGGDYVGTTFSRANPNDVAVFNNATQTSIVKIIPNLLSKIYGEIRTIRTGEGNPEDHELTFDYNRQKLITRHEFKGNFLKDTSIRLKHYTKVSINVIKDLYKEYGKFTEDELNAIGTSVISYVITSNSKMNPSILLSKEYLDHIPSNIRKRVYSAGKKILSAAIENPMIVEDIKSALIGIRTKIPDMTSEIEMMYATGNAPMLEDMGLLERDEVNNSFSINRDNTLNTLRVASGMKLKNNTIKAVNPMNNITADNEPIGSDDLEEIKRKFLYNDDGTKKSMADLRKEFFNSEEYKQKIITDFPEWIKSNLGKGSKINSIFKNIPNNLKDTKNWVTDKIKKQKDLGKTVENFEDDIVNTIVGSEDKSLSDLRTEFMESPEYQSGAVQNFPEWLEAQGLGPNGKRKKSSSRMWKLLQFTWSLDRKIAKAMFKYPWKAAKGTAKLAGKLGYSGGKWGLPKLLKGAGYTASALPLNLYYLLQEGITGKPATGGLPSFGLDRTMAKGITKGPKVMAKFMGKSFSMFGKIKKGVARPYNWLFKAGVDAGVSSDTQAVLAGLDELNSNMAEMNANTPKKSFLDPDGDGLRKGDWRSRLKLFSKSKENKEGDKKNKGLLTFMKENKGLTLAGGVLLMSGLLKALNLSADEMVSGIKAIGSGVSAVFKGIRWVGEKIGTVIDGIGKFFGFKSKKQKVDENGNPVVDSHGNPVYEDEEEQEGSSSASKTAGTLIAGGAAIFAARHPIKATKMVGSLGVKIVTTLINMCKGKFGVGWIGEMLEKNKGSLVSNIDKSVGNFDKLKKFFSKISKAITNPKFISKIGAKVIAKVSAKITAAIAAAATGIGGILTLGTIMWEIGWALYYMYSKDLTFTQALLYQLFGTTFTDDELDSYAKGGDGLIETEANGNLSTTYKDEAGDDRRLEIQANGVTREYYKDDKGEWQKGTTVDRRDFKKDSISYNKYKELRLAHNKKKVDIINNNGGEMSFRDFKEAWKESGSSSTRIGEAASNYTRNTKSQGKCAKGVRSILMRAGYRNPVDMGFDVRSAYLYAKPQMDGITPLEGMGLSRVDVDPVNYTPEDGDVAVIDRGPKSNKEHGHIAVWSEKIRSWVSDFIQPDKNDPSPYGKSGLKARINPDEYRRYVSIWRDEGAAPIMPKDNNGNEGMTNQKPDDGNKGGNKNEKGLLRGAWDTMVSWVSGDDQKQNPTKEGLGAAEDSSSPSDILKTDQMKSNGINSAQPLVQEIKIKELNLISDTLIKSLKVQIYMAETLSRIAENSKNLNIDPNDVGNPNMSNIKPTEVGGSMPPSVVDIKRKQYLMPV